MFYRGPSRWLSGKESTCQAGKEGSISGSGRSLGEGNDNPLQCSCLGNPMDRGVLWATAHGVTNSQTRLIDWAYTQHTHTHTNINNIIWKISIALKRKDVQSIQHCMVVSYLKGEKHALRVVYLLSGNYLGNRGEMKITCEVSAVPQHLSAKNA